MTVQTGLEMGHMLWRDKLVMLREVTPHPLPTSAPSTHTFLVRWLSATPRAPWAHPHTVLDACFL